jgi:hypothetical protein
MVADNFYDLAFACPLVASVNVTVVVGVANVTAL